MKTPRETLLTQHRITKPKLDAIRQSVVAAVCDRRQEETAERRSTTSVLQTFWLELIWSSRRIWAGLAAVWLVLAVFNFSQRGGTQTILAQSSSPAVMTMTFRDQQKLLSDLFTDRLPKVDADRPKIFSPKPRTEVSEFFTI